MEDEIMAVAKCKAVIMKKELLADGIVSMWLQQPEMSEVAKAGQFVSVYCNSQSRLLPRPISICEIDKENSMLRLVYRIAGEGTKEISKLSIEDTIEIMGPLGNGFTLQENSAILIGGGIGIPPMLELAKELKKEIGCKLMIVLGYRNEDTFLLHEFESYGTVYVSTEDGSIGTKGNVIDAIKENQIEADMIYACGPTPMLKGVKQYALEHGIEAQISMEERMACGIGACLACVCKSKEVDSHSHVTNKRVCKDGPVFNVREVEL